MCNSANEVNYTFIRNAVFAFHQQRKIPKTMSCGEKHQVEVEKWKRSEW